MNKKIVIIGAGPSGIAAATKLIENGFTNLTILEAESRIGGRVNTVPFGNGVAEVGAQYCHGIRNNAVYDLAFELGYLSEMALGKTISYPIYDTNGLLVPADKSMKLFLLANHILESEEIISYKGSLGNFFMEKYWDALKDKAYDDIDDKLRNQFSKLFHKFQNVYDGTDTWYMLSCLSYGNYEDDPGLGENLIWNTNSRGYATVLDLLQKKLPGQGAPIDIKPYVQLNKEAKKILYNLNTESIVIECTDGSITVADHLICTVSLGVMKERHLSLFDPILPQKKVDAIDTISFGVVDKIIFEFERPFWPNNWEGCAIAWSPEQLKLIRDNEETRWIEGISGFHPIDNQPNVLLGWISGASARKMETIPADLVISQCMKLLKMLLKDFDVPDQPKNHLRSQWFSNPHFRGSYSSISTETNAMNASNADLAEPLLAANKRPIIQFAGEATSEHHFSTVHGAIESGWREANRFIAFYNQNKN